MNFEVLESSIFFIVILWIFKKQLCEISKGGEGVFAFLFVNFEIFCFGIFEILESSIFLLRGLQK